MLFPSSPVTPARSLHAEPEGPAAPRDSSLAFGKSKRFILYGDSPAWTPPSSSTPLWAAGTAQLPALLQVRAQLLWPPSGRGNGRVLELHLKSLPGGMDLKIWWTLRQKRGKERTLLPFHCGISGCPAEKGLSMGTL